MPIFDAALVTGLFGLAGGIAGDAFSASSASDTNTTNAQINQQSLDASMQRQLQAEDFNSNQGYVQRAFNAQQVQQQEQFQQGMLTQAENYNTQMSDTAMQRRVADLQAAGINPLLAISQGGASTPTISPMPGAAATSAAPSIGAAGSPGMIPMQNPGQAFSNLGSQITNSIEASKAASQIDLLQAQADKTRAESDTQIPANVDYLKSMTGLTDRQADQAYYQTMRIQEQIYGQRLSNDQLRDITMPLQGIDLQVAKATRDALISAANSDATAKALGLPQMRNLSNVAQSNLGQILTYINAILGPVGTAAKAAGALQ